ncbi:uncharacterized protein LOC130548499 [Triplophysa rosa]|uniref:uncharacterized protein LOC130548499 n=1 Tax=Triplophysa rosa TaxID=992332 RepID=UPI002546196F|nr:uncharacterized protein LOC130548499 [Triplophysa rosa]
MVLLFVLVLCLSAGDVRMETEINVMEGDSVALRTGLAKINQDDNIIWTFGETFLVNIYKGFHVMSSFDGTDGRFINRLSMDSQTGSLTIKNINTNHSGLYYLFHNNASSKIFSVAVHALLPVPVITRDVSLMSSSSERSSVSKCVLLCSVMNVTHVSLSWYKGKSLLSSISVSDLYIRLSLPLEVEYQDTNTYRCVINNHFTNHTQHLHINDVCQTCLEHVRCFSFTEAVIRLVLSALVGVAIIAIVVYDIRSS